MKKQIVLIIVILISIIGKAQNDSVIYKNINDRIDDVEIKIDKVEMSLAKDINQTNKNLNLTQSQLNDMKTDISNVESRLWNERFGFLEGTIAIVTAIFSVFFVLFGFKKLIERKANEVFENVLLQRLSDIKEKDIEHLYNVIESSGWKAQIRNKRILVLNQTETKIPEDLRTALKVFNTEYRDIESITNVSNINYKDYSLVVVENNEDVGFWSLDKYENDFIKLADDICSNGTSFIYYSGKNGRFPTTNVNRHLVNYSNSPSTLYNNIMNTLKFRDLLEQNKEI